MDNDSVNRTAAYQRIRLWSGVFSVGAHLVLGWLAFLVAGWMPAEWLSMMHWMAWLAFTLLGFALFGLVFDKLVGYEVERYRGATAQSAGAWLRDWAWGATVQGVLMFTGLSVWVLLLRPLNLFLVLFCVCVGAGVAAWVLPRIFLPWWRVASRPELEREVLATLREWEVPIERIKWYEDGSTEMLNGSLLPGCAREVWLTTAVAKLAPREMALLIRREFHFRAKGFHAWALVIVCGWVGAGVLLAMGLPAVNAWQQAMALAAVMTTWCFLALFVWPPLNRVWMRSADRSLLAVASREEVASLLRLLQQSNESDVTLSDTKQSIFHPIPSLENRLKEFL